MEMDGGAAIRDDRFGVRGGTVCLSNSSIMENSALIQYLIVALLVGFAVWYLIRILRKTFSPGKFKNGKPGCDSDCGCG
jgi:hypothetical protein